MTEFQKSVYNVVRSIPKGETLSYAEVAEQSGHPGAARAVGTLMKKNFDPSVPCHRVICASGRPGEYNRGGEARKMALLQEESSL